MGAQRKRYDTHDTQRHCTPRILPSSHAHQHQRPVNPQRRLSSSIIRSLSPPRVTPSPPRRAAAARLSTTTSSLTTTPRLPHHRTTTTTTTSSTVEVEVETRTTPCWLAKDQRARCQDHHSLLPTPCR